MVHQVVPNLHEYISSADILRNFLKMEKNTMKVNGYKQLSCYEHSSSKKIVFVFIRIWNNTRASKLWQNFHFWVNHGFKNAWIYPANSTSTTKESYTCHSIVITVVSISLNQSNCDPKKAPSVQSRAISGLICTDDSMESSQYGSWCSPAIVLFFPVKKHVCFYLKIHFL